MTITQMLGQSLILTGLGLSVVFSFLIIMIFCMSISSKLVQIFEKKQKTNTNGTSSTATNANDSAIVAAIAGALHDKQ